MENWTFKDAGSGENTSPAEREESVQEQANIEAPETAPQEEQSYQTPTNDDGDYVVNLDNPPNLEDNAISERETTEVSVDEPSGDSGEVEPEVREQPEQEVSETPDAEFTIEAIEEDEPAQEEAVVEKVVEAPIADPEPQVVLPEGMEKLVEFMNETGGTLEDYVGLNKDITTMSPTDTIREYYKKKYPHYDTARIERKMNKEFAYDQEVDEPDVVQDKQDAFQDELFAAQKFLNENRDKYYAELKANPRNSNPETQKAVEFYNDYTKQQEAEKQNVDKFHKLTEQVFNDDFKGFDFKVGESKFRVKVGDVNKTMNAQKDLNNFINSFIDESGNIQNVKDYHKALYAARNVDKLAQHFYEQGRADAIKQSAAKAKNIDMQPRQDAASVVTPSGTKFRVVSGDSGNKLRIKMKQ